MSRPVRPPRRLRLLLLVVTCILVLGACAGRRTIPDQYGDTTRDNFQEGCVEALTVDRSVVGDPDQDADGFVPDDLGEGQPFSADRASNVCSCSYEGISGPDGIPFEEFKQINDDFEDDPGPLPESIASIVDGCVDQVPAS